MKKDEKTIAFKGFDKNFKCRDFQFEIGKSYTHSGKVKACESGFHSCEYPLDIFNYYNPCSSMFAMVEASGEIDKDDDDSKIASKNIFIKKEIDLHELISEAIKYTISKTNPAIASTNSGDYGASTNSGARGASTNSGKHGVSANFAFKGKSRGCIGTALFLVERNEKWEILNVWAGIVDGNEILPDVFYSLVDGKPCAIGDMDE